MTALINVPITTAQSAVTSTVLQFLDTAPSNLVLQANFTYGSGGTSVSAWVQTSFDGGITWSDAANFSFTTASSRVVANLTTNAGIYAAFAVTDGALAANTVNPAVIGFVWRVKLTTVGTYAGGTSLRIDAVPNAGRLTL